jgi:hypothetical protein
MPKTVPTKPYDWTYTTVYQGHTTSSTSESWKPADPSNPAHSIPMAELTRPDPILFYAEIPLFESELDDNGASSLLIRIVSDTSQEYATTLIAMHTARDARVHLYSCTLFITSGQRVVSNIRHTSVPFIFLFSSLDCEGNQWVGGAI